MKIPTKIIKNLIHNTKNNKQDNTNKLSELEYYKIGYFTLILSGSIYFYTSILFKH